MVIAIALALSINALSQTGKHIFSCDECFPDSMGYYISKALPAGWSLERNGKRLVISRTDSVYFDSPPALNPDYIYEPGPDTADYYRSYPKHKLEVYIDFRDQNWTDATYEDSVRYDTCILRLLNGLMHNRRMPGETLPDEDYRLKDTIKMLCKKYVKLPEAFTQSLAMYLLNNVPKGYNVLSTKARNIGGEKAHEPLFKEIADLKNICKRVIHDHLNIPCGTLDASGHF